jgi:hypothetical protein
MGVMFLHHARIRMARLGSNDPHGRCRHRQMRGMCVPENMEGCGRRYMRSFAGVRDLGRS